MNNNKHTQDVWNKVLSNNEELKYEFSISKKYINTSIIIRAIICIPVLFLNASIGIILLIIILLYFKIYLPKANIYGFTNKRVLIHRGFFSTELISVDYSKITDVTVHQSFMERDSIFDCGEISINTAGSSGKEIVLRNVSKPYDIKKKLDELRDNI